MTSRCSSCESQVTVLKWGLMTEQNIGLFLGTVRIKTVYWKVGLEMFVSGFVKILRKSVFSICNIISKEFLKAPLKNAFFKVVSENPIHCEVFV